MKRLPSILFWLLILVVNGVVLTYHAGVFPPPEVPEISDPEHEALWIDKSVHGMNQLVLQGGAYERGLAAGRATSDLLRRQETELVGQLRKLIPSDIALQALILAGINWFRGIDAYFEPWATREMYGVSFSAPAEFNYLADPFTRQIAYHGLHEVGQMMVDQQGDQFGCTVVAIPDRGNWILGRNFDFEGGRTFDEEKILKWVFPDEGNAFVSVIWAGMVGAVTGVNDKGLYISLNAGGSEDFRRIGAPSTLLLLKALQFSSDLDEAIRVIRDGTMFITDSFVLLDAATGRLISIEKSPQATEVSELRSPAVITNHLLSPRWINDEVNAFRRDELTSTYRYVRARELLDRLEQEKIDRPSELEERVLAILRDKGEGLEIGNRRAIDALIATHAVVYNASDRVFYVSQGPSLVGGFTGFDLRASFAARRPIESARRLPPDTNVNGKTYRLVHEIAHAVSKARSLVSAREGDCAAAARELDRLPSSAEPLFGSGYWSVKGDIEDCQGHRETARAFWQKALASHPAYAKDVRRLEEKLSQ